MSDIETQVVYRGSWVTAHSLPTGQILARPIYVKHWLNGSFMTVDDARKLVQELNDALAHLPLRRT